ncbi:uncharacterized protein LOC131286273 [Anopheles ziemanni]|uniref:uncharacterized protein LOC131265992 n=1 Tax=Anopheles coustani TaxID=139045 RepID=UPI002658E35C|nr:uncharacterized protein LOC131265992 [Anopheles coustani]XP_058171191.1 uncharacterized protein LOC131286273 [Anopheles ziemanni]
MRKVWLLASAVLAFLNFVKSQEVARTLYSARYDNLDIDTILGSNRLVSNYVDCLLSRKPCPPEGKDLKRILPEALRTKCARCSPIQKENALKIITRLYFDYPDQYRALRERWDPSGEYHRRFEDYLRGLQFNQIGGNGGTNGGQAPSGGDNGNTVVENGGGNDRPVRNDLDRQPASQSSNVQAVVIDPTLSSGSVNTLLANPPPPPAPATERPRPPAPVAQILFPTTSVTSETRTTTAPPLVVVNRFGEDAATVRPPPVQTVPTTTTQRTTTTVRQTRPVTRQTTTRNTQRTTTRFITRVPPTPPPTPSRTTPTTTTTILPPRPPPPPPPPPPSRPLPPPAQQQPLLPQAPQQPPQQAYPTIFYERPQAPPPRATAPPPPPPPIYVPDSAPTPYGTTPDSIIDHFFVPPSSQAANPPLPPSPIVGLWNQLGTKIADTADAIAGMLQKTVDVLVTSHIQSHQRALRRT